MGLGQVQHPGCQYRIGCPGEAYQPYIPPPTEEQVPCCFASWIPSGYLCSAIHHLIDQSGRGVLDPAANCTKMGLPVLEVLKTMYCKLQDPTPLEGLDEAFKP